ncbi:MAG: hypothetical protein HY304_03255 [candidate division Zixibacteria bacterium]|nr:hypothetical protein [candidate division Zixibacteria bacterium]
MRTMLKVTIPVETGNKAIKDGSLPKLMESFMQKNKPEAAYFFPEGGKRTAMFVLNLPDPTYIPSITEPFFSGLNADVSMSPVMNADDLRAGLDKAMKAMS